MLVMKYRCDLKHFKTGKAAEVWGKRLVKRLGREARVDAVGFDDLEGVARYSFRIWLTGQKRDVYLFEEPSGEDEERKFLLWDGTKEERFEGLNDLIEYLK